LFAKYFYLVNSINGKNFSLRAGLALPTVQGLSFVFSLFGAWVKSTDGENFTEKITYEVKRISA